MWQDVTFHFPLFIISGIVLQHGFNATEQRDTVVFDAFVVQGLLQRRGKKKNLISNNTVNELGVHINALGVLIRRFNAQFELLSCLFLCKCGIALARKYTSKCYDTPFFKSWA